MCRFTFYQGKPIRLGTLITEPKHSLINQSFQSAEREEPLNGDGFGLAWYNFQISDEPALFKSVQPAWGNANLFELARIIESPCILAHVRAATQGLGVTEVNCHPFKWENYAFMHNGDVGGFHQIRRPLLNLLSNEAFDHIRGTTDSEHVFALLQDELRQRESLPPHDRLASAMMGTIKKLLALQKENGITQKSYLNMVVSDGSLALAVRCTTDDPQYADSLYMNLGKRYVCEEGVCHMVNPGEHEKAVIISSEPLSADPGWEPVPVNSMVIVRDGVVLDRLQINTEILH